MDLFDLQDGYGSLIEGVSRIKCPVLVNVLHAICYYVIKHINGPFIVIIENCGH